jgi:hypothetical protein
MAMENPYNGDEPARIEDPEELSQQKRINELLDRRQAVLEARDRAIDEATLGQATEQDALQHYQSRIESLILDLWTKFESESTANEKKGRQYLDHEHIDSIMVPPPADLLPNSESDMAAGADYPDPKAVHIEGLRWFIENEPVVTRSFTIQSWNPPGEYTGTNSRHVPFRTLDKALVYCLKFMDETGIDADFEDDTDDAEFDYSDLLDPDGDDPE